MNGDEFTQQDANQPESSAPENSPAQSNPESSAMDAPKADAQVPFHEHPRFKELIEERRQFAEKQKALEEQLEQLRYQRSEPVPTKATAPLVEKMREIDPRYAEYLEQLEARAAKAEALEQRFQQYETRSVAQQYESSFEKLCSENKVPAEWKELYDSQIQAMAVQNPKLGLKDLPDAFKGIHEKFSKLIEGTKRAERNSYVTDKTKDASTPSSQPKGKTASGRKDENVPQDREALLASIAKSALKRSKAESDL